jgi:hypothetical protein
MKPTAQTPDHLVGIAATPYQTVTGTSATRPSDLTPPAGSFYVATGSALLAELHHEAKEWLKVEAAVGAEAQDRSTGALLNRAALAIETLTRELKTCMDLQHAQGFPCVPAERLLANYGVLPDARGEPDGGRPPKA